MLDGVRALIGLGARSGRHCGDWLLRRALWTVALARSRLDAIFFPDLDRLSILSCTHAFSSLGHVNARPSLHQLYLIRTFIYVKMVFCYLFPAKLLNLIRSM